MASLAYRESGSGPDVVVLVHGVGVDARAFDPIVGHLGEHHTVVVPDRRGYESSAHLPLSPLFDAQVDDLAALVASLRGGATSADARSVTVVGVSGGATVALALAIRHASNGIAPAGPVVVHEPLLGDLAPRLAARVREGYARTLRVHPAQASRYVRELVGSATWSRLDDDARARVAARAGLIAAEVPAFLGFRPSWTDLRALRGGPVLTSIGARSASPRWEAADVLGLMTGRAPVVVEAAGHLPQVDAPERFAQLIIETMRGAAPFGSAPSATECPA
jgi:pimeloyl-ACP methyl ester carboxylesterase